MEGDDRQAVEVSGVRASGRVSFTLELLKLTAASKNERTAYGDINAIALVLERTDGKARAEVESSADEFEIAPFVLRAKPDAD